MRLPFIALYLASSHMFVIGNVPVYHTFEANKKSETKIFGGQIAPPGQYLWLVHRNYKCAGSLIDPHWILTAAHCIWNIGDTLHFHQSPEEISQPKTATVAEVIRHPDFDFKFATEQFDIALIRIEKAIIHTKAIRIIGPEENIFLKPGTLLQVVGWGSLHEGGDSHNELMFTQIPILSNTVCGDSNHYGQLGKKIFDSNVCAGFDNGGHDACAGDSGGPLLLERDHELVIVGTVSWGVGCGNPYRPGVYTRVSSYRDWIYETMSKKTTAAIFDNDIGISHISSPWPSAPLSCIEKCGNPMVILNDQDYCACDTTCLSVNDCCFDFSEVCIDTQDFISSEIKSKLPVLTLTPGLQYSAESMKENIVSKSNFFSIQSETKRLQNSDNIALTSVSCRGNCGLWTGICYCDSGCVHADDCCDDFFDVGCIADSSSLTSLDTDSCVGNCGFWTGQCYCDENCHMQGDCCEDIADVCLHDIKVTDGYVYPTMYSCNDRCGMGIGNCFCDKGCIEQGDCCEDYYEMCKQPQLRQLPSLPTTLGRVPNTFSNPSTNGILKENLLKSLFVNSNSVSQHPLSLDTETSESSSSVGTIHIPWPDSSLQNANEDEENSFNSDFPFVDTSQIVHAWPVTNGQT